MSTGPRAGCSETHTHTHTPSWWIPEQVTELQSDSHAGQTEAERPDHKVTTEERWRQQLAAIFSQKPPESKLPNQEGTSETLNVVETGGNWWVKVKPCG